MFFLIIFTLLGIIIGSFINLLEFKTRNNIKLRDLNKIKGLYNINILSYIFSLGKYKNISKQYIFIKILSGLIFFIGFIINDKYHVFNGIFGYISYILFLFSLIYISLYDIKYKEIPTNGYIGLIIGSIYFLYYSNYNLIYNIIFSISWFLFLYIIDIIYKIYYSYKNKIKFIKSPDSIGGGDLKMSFFLGIILQNNVFLGIIFSYFIGSFIILIYKIIYFNKKLENEISFGPMMLISTFIIIFFNNIIIKIFGF